MDLSIPDELRLLQGSVREFVTRELKPLEAQVERADAVDPATSHRLRQLAVELGLCGFNLPTTVGGGGLGPLAEAVIGIEMGRTTMALGEVIGRLPPALAFATPDQLDWLVAALLRGDTTVCSALTEPDAGSDLGMVRTTARLADGGWRISGHKQFISNADSADVYLVLAVTDPDADLRHRFTVFAVDRGGAGVTTFERFEKMGWRGYSVGAFALDDCFVDGSRVLGGVGAGFDVIMASVNRTRLYLAAKCVGMAEELQRLACSYASSRQTFGRPLSGHQAIQFQIADMDVELEAARLLVFAAAWSGEEGAATFRVAASRAKLYASEMVGRAADKTLQIFGGAGYMCDLPVERMYRDARAFRIGEGTSEMQRLQIARYTLKEGVGARSP